MSLLKTFKETLVAKSQLNTTTPPCVVREFVAPSGVTHLVVLHDYTIYNCMGITSNIPGCCYTIPSLELPTHLLVGNREFFKLPLEVQDAYLHHEAAHIALGHDTQPPQTIFKRFLGCYDQQERDADEEAFKHSDMLGALLFLKNSYPYGLSSRDFQKRIKHLQSL